MPDIGIGVIGGGYMGKAHSVAFAAVGAVFETALRPRLAAICGASPASGARYAAAYGFARGASDWRDLVNDPTVEAVVIASPQATHREIAEAALALGKPVLCEKPMGLNVGDARAMVAAAEAAGVANMVAYNYIRTPASQYARQLVAEGALGRITHFRGEHTEDFHNEDVLGEWRFAGEANGCLGDLTPHIINAALAIMGPIDELSAVMETVYPERGGVPVTNDDQVQMMVRFASGAGGHLASSRVATGRKMGYAYEITGTQGAIRFDQEDQNALWLYHADAPPAQRGFRKILTGPAHPDYLPFCQGPGHGTGYQDQIIIEAHDFLKAIDGGAPVWPTFRDGLEVHRVIAAARASHATRGWTKPAEY
ncbi:Gfo/Idh/MocA family oxidoreductase [Aestuariicoccus sp. MJ-SS9]|uniref:Gfo/Idh/MocA family protein n=1 Tax=Aestuariicoccus sp. MJ-SS9 TaxID=3079855 RepID=UPI002910FBBA|nr:Gfo/Idh/MocA family oxidoreductase [Aestuariicoccus sp. MJ-SS9]MDU8912024.1 Gfo/Idh/MocA family oxidoreductase [Aestuariicoccus sp. MJ-SS9]